MKILDWYILKKFLKSYVFVVFVIELVVVIIHITEQNENYIKHELSAAQIFGYYLDYVPYIANMIAPITIFITVVFVTSQLAQHSEIIAMLSSGVSFTRLMRPYMFGAIIIGAITFYLGGWVIPNGNKDRVAFELQYIKGTYHYSGKNIHIKIAPTTMLYLQSYNVTSNVGYKPTLETLEDGVLKNKLEAVRMEWQDETEKWRLRTWKKREIDGMNEIFTTGEQLDTTLRISPKDFESDYSRFETLTMNELYAYIDELRMRGADDIEVYEIEKYIRYTAPFAAIILTFIGLSVSARKARGGSGFQIALGFLLAFIYIIFFIFSRTSAEAGSITPIVAIWIPNIVFTIIGLAIYQTVPR
ncbi:MAG: YjgP/YjgQ family permease [Cyclobacteriaceae bacterium]|nr:YjgP/YjgQ family permease [Cyclobacteriaceae bacterium]